MTRARSRLLTLGKALRLTVRLYPDAHLPRAGLLCYLGPPLSVTPITFKVTLSVAKVRTETVESAVKLCRASLALGTSATHNP